MSENWGRLDDQLFYECGEVHSLGAEIGTLEHLQTSKTSSHVHNFTLNLIPKSGIKSRTTILLGKNQKHVTTGAKPKIFTRDS